MATADGEGGAGAGEPVEAPPMATVLVAIAIAASLLLGVTAALRGGASGVEPTGPTREQQARAVAVRYAAAWERGDVAAMSELLFGAAPAFAELHDSWRVGLDVRSARVSARSARVAPGGERATVPLGVRLEVGGLGTWEYDTSLALVWTEPEAVTDGDEGKDPAVAPEPAWRVAWSPSTVHPELTAERRFDRTRSWRPRAPVLAVDGTPLTGEGAPPLPALANQVLGRVTALDVEAASALGSPYLPGDTAGRSGLAAAFERRLAGAPSGEVRLLEDDDVVAVLHTFEGRAPEPVRITVDPAVQAAAESALPEGGKPAALVAVAPDSGEVRAVVSRPALGFNRALVGRYPPGSTFKVVTTSALLASGVTPASPVSCPPTTTVNGYRFSNAGGEALGDIPFRTAFFRSCNTAFVQQAEKLDDGALLAAAQSMGFNRPLDLPVEAVGGSFPAPSGPVEHAAAAIGQGRVTASPLQMAAVAGAVAAGAHRSPTLVLDPPGVAPEPVALADGVAPTLQELMRLVVAEGTGTAARLPGEPVAGKTGTAEYGSASPPRTHAWFIGFRGSLAVAVLVEDGGFGGSVAAPIAADLFRRVG